MKKTLSHLCVLCLLALAVSACATSRTATHAGGPLQKTHPQDASPHNPLWQTSSGKALQDTFFSQTLLFGSGLAASADDFLTRARQADYILIGERHTSASHHEAQAAIIALLAENDLTPAIGLEMIPAKSQPLLDRFNARETSLEELPERLDWATIWGFDFALYRPIFLAAERYNAPVYGLNVSPEVIKSIREHDTPARIPAIQKQELPPVIQYPTSLQQEQLSRFFKQHATMLMAQKSQTASKSRTQGAPRPDSTTPKSPASGTAKATPGMVPQGQKTPSATPAAERFAEPSSRAATGSGAGLSAVSPTVALEHPARRPEKSLGKSLAQGLPKGSVKSSGKGSAKPPAPGHGTKALRRFITIQSLWDSAMGYNATTIKHPGPKVILAGGAHVEYGHGIAYRIRHYEPDATILIVMPLASPKHKLAGQADFYYLEKR